MDRPSLVVIYDREYTIVLYRGELFFNVSRETFFIFAAHPVLSCRMHALDSFYFW